MSDPIKPERIQKVLARMGLGSRREIESWIKAGRIMVNGSLAKLGDVITTEDRVQLDKKQIKFPRKVDSRPRVIAYHKPAGEICTRKDTEGRAILELLKVSLIDMVQNEVNGPIYIKAAS